MKSLGLGLGRVRLPRGVGRGGGVRGAAAAVGGPGVGAGRRPRRRPLAPLAQPRQPGRGRHRRRRVTEYLRRAPSDPDRHAEGDGGDRRRGARARRRADRPGRLGDGDGRPAGCWAGRYGRVVNVIAGPGNNGADGRAAGADPRTAGREGARVRRLRLPADAARRPTSSSTPPTAPGSTATGGRPRVGATPVLAVDIPSGVDGLTGEAGRGVLAADRTVTFAALKPGLLFGAGRGLAGEVEVADIGLDVSSTNAYVVEPADVARWWRPRPPTAHKWSRAVRVVAGGPGMTGAAHLAAGAAQRAGAGMVALSSPGVDPSAPPEVVRHRLPAFDWAGAVLADLHRYHALVIGPGLGRDDYAVAAVRAAVARRPAAGRRRRRRAVRDGVEPRRRGRAPAPPPRRHRAHAPRRRVRPAHRPPPAGRSHRRRPRPRHGHPRGACC